MRTGCHYLIGRLSICLSMCMFNTRRFSDCKSCTRPIPTNLGSMETGEYRLTRGTCSVAWRLELDAIAGLPCRGVAGFRVFFFRFMFFERNAHSLLQV